ncbi:membrane protein [Mycobacterium seoulense]|uniref:Membrane protein n=1 Tax=Mycobacterium seoulense TaxID=386911 RepID=A0A7I7NWP0_9MYCO|nr:membrane protein [Mycobacterium seoulense]
MALAGALLLAVPPNAHADVVAYLLNVTVRPGYHFADADAALVYGHGICDKISRGRSYAQVMADVKDDLNTSDEFQASYLISQAVNELCPALIWQLRKSASN